jgi:hypothetical protein
MSPWNSVTLRKEYKQRVLGTTVLRTVFEPKRAEVRDSKKLHNEAFRKFYSSPNIIQMITPKRVLRAELV